MVKKLQLIIAIGLVFFLSCTWGQNNKFPIEPIRYPAPNNNYARDSFYLAYTVYQFNILKVQGYGGIKKENFLRVDIDTILYSPDSLKLFSFIISCIKDIESDKTSYHFNGQTIIAFRRSMHEAWTVYPVLFTAFLGYDNYNMVRNRLREEYFHRFKDMSDWFWNSDRQDYDSVRFGYNVNDRHFWDSSIVWKEGARIPGFYMFQTPGNVKPGYQGGVLKLPELHYPDSLLKLYERGSVPK